MWDDEKQEGPITKTTATSHPIEAEGPPLRAKPCRTTPVEGCIIWKHINKMVKRKVIRKSNSPWAAPILLADKKNGNVQFCVDFHCLNEKTKKDSYPLPHMDEILAALGSSSYFSSIDLFEAFWSISIREGDIEKAAFTSKYGLWEFLSMPFGLCNTPATQQQLLKQSWVVWFGNVVLPTLMISFVTAQRLNNIWLIWWKFPKIEGQWFDAPTSKVLVLQAKFWNSWIYHNKGWFEAKSEKSWGNPELPTFDYSKGSWEIFGNGYLVKTVHPRSSSLTTHLRKAKVMDPKKFSLSQESIKEIHLLKELLTSETCMAHPDFSKEFFIYVDASKLGLGAILTQMDQDGHHRVIEYASRTLTETQQKYTNPLWEGLGILWALNNFKYYICGQNSIVFCDCESLKFVFKTG